MEDVLAGDVADADGDQKRELVKTIVRRLDGLFGLVFGTPAGMFGPTVDFVRSVMTHTIKAWPSMPPDAARSENNRVYVADFLELRNLVILDEALSQAPRKVDGNQEVWKEYAHRLRSTVLAIMSEALVMTSLSAYEMTPVREVFRGYLEEDDSRALAGRVAATQEQLERAELRWQEINANAAESSGEGAQSEMATHFGYYGKSHRRAAEATRAVAVVLVGAVSVFLYFSLNLPAAELSWLELIRRLALTLPLLGLAGYLARESSKHREASNWAATISVQLRTVKAFTDPLPEEVRNAIRTNFAAVVFGHYPLGSVNDSLGAVDVDGAMRRVNELKDLLPGQGGKN